MHFLHDTFEIVEPYLRHYGLFALLLIIYLEALGAPLPGESALIGSAVLAANGQFPILGVFAVVVIGATLGDNTGYLIGRFGGRAVIERFGKYIGMTAERRERVERLYDRHGASVVVGARFVVILRQLNGIVAGTMAMRWRAFLLANVTGALLWGAVYTFIPYYFSDEISAYFKHHSHDQQTH